MPETEPDWKSLFKLAGKATLILLVYSLVTMILVIVFGGQPENAGEVFAMIQANRLVGLLRLDVLTSLVMPLYYLLFLGFFAALKRTHMALSVVAALIGCAGVTLFLTTPSAFSWLTLSEKFAPAGDAQKTLLPAAGEAILASDMWHGTGALMGVACCSKPARCLPHCACCAATTLAKSPPGWGSSCMGWICCTSWPAFSSPRLVWHR